MESGPSAIGRVHGRRAAGLGPAGLGAIGLGTTVVPLDGAVNIALPHIVQAMGMPLAAIQWVIVCYVLTHSCLMLGAGRLGDLFGYRRVFGVGLAVSALAFVACGAAQSFGWLLLARVLQGLGASFVIACGPALATSLYPEGRRSRVLGAYTAMFSLGMALGPSLGGLLVEAWGWSAVFWFRLPICLIALAGLALLPRPAPRGAGGRFDFTGGLLLALSLGAFLLALNQFRNASGPLAPLALAGLAVAAVAGFLAHARRVPDPAIRIEVFRNLDFSILNVANVAVNLAGFGVMLLAPFYLHRMTELSVPEQGLVLACAPLGGTIAGALGGLIGGRAPASRLSFLAALLVAGGLWLVSQWGPEEAIGTMAGCLFLGGFGLGLFLYSYMDTVTATLPRTERGVAGSLAMATRTAGVVCGATFGTMVFDGLWQARLARAATGQAAEAAAFLTSFQDSFALAALGLALFMLLTLLRPRVWFG